MIAGVQTKQVQMRMGRRRKHFMSHDVCVFEQLCQKHNVRRFGDNTNTLLQKNNTNNTPMSFKKIENDWQHKIWCNK
jgi:hypothetical protein